MSKRKDIEYVYARTWIGRESMSPADEHIWELGRISGIREAAQRVRTKITKTSHPVAQDHLQYSSDDLMAHARKLKRRLTRASA